ncbi:MAG: ATP-dependent DNA helicase RecG [bacterium]|nr:ATP-dependent DNA helicase RecG [bacterium]
MFSLSTPIEQLYLVGPARAKLLKNLEITTLADLLFYFPRTHHDLSKITPICDLKPDEPANVKARVLTIKSFRTKVRRLTLTHALIEDNTGSMLCMWFNQPFLSKIIKPQTEFLFSGKVILDKKKLTFQSPVYEQVKQEQIHTARLVPIYPLTAQLTQKQLRTIIKTYLDKIIVPEYLPKDLLKKEKLLNQNEAVKQFHFPLNYKALKAAQERLAFDEIFQTQLRVLQYKKTRQLKNSFKIESVEGLEQKISTLPYTLTKSQSVALEQITADLAKPYPANRLLEGDVGSGKTIVAALSMWLVAQNNFQASLLTPTEILAQQHFANLLDFFTKDNINVGLLTSTSSKLNNNPVSKNTLLSQIQDGNVQVAIGTHALFEKKVEFKNLGLVVIDEQHRFGVEQRSMLKNTHNAHLLTMSATPIPRTLALTLYGDLDITVLSELPKGRIRIKTALVPEAKREKAYEFIRDEIKSGKQIFVICPLVEESDKLEVKSATAEYKKLSEEIYPDLKVGLLHGKMKPREKEEIMRQFQEGSLHILVSTSVVEVGVDVPNATIMMIEGAERFGLAQLHQFRGRVGRSTHQSYCFLFSSDPRANINPRLLALTQSSNGFELAEKDLQIRGAGDLYGTQQSGYGFKIATLANLEMVEKSREYANTLLDQDLTLNKYPLIKEKILTKPMVHLE